MRTPESLIALVDDGIIDSVQRPLMSGKEAHIYLVESGGAQRVAKIYKDAQNRSFQNRADYTEGRKVRNSRDQRAMGSRSKHGRSQNEAAWKSAEVDMIYRLRHAGVRVPTPFNFVDGVLIMELVTDADGFPAPRLGDLTFEPEHATAIFHRLLAEVVRMLCAGVVHGDLSEFNVLMDESGPVIIDFPQAVDAGSNANARKLLARDIENLQRFHAKFVPNAPVLPYAQELWDLYSRSALTPETQLTGKFRTKERAVTTHAVLDLIADAERDERRRRQNLGLSMRGAGQGDRRAPTEGGGAGRGDERARQERGAGQAHRVAPRHDAPRSPATREHPSRGASQPRRDASHEAPVRADRPVHPDRPPQRRDAHRAESPAPAARRVPEHEHAARSEAPGQGRQEARNERSASHADRSPFRAWQAQAEARGASGKTASSGFGARRPRDQAQATQAALSRPKQPLPQRAARPQADEERQAPAPKRERDPR